MTAPHTVQASMADTHSLREIMSVGQQSHTQRINLLRKKVQSFFARDGPLRRDYEDFAIFSKEASLMFAYIFAGWNDATAGSLLPAIQKQYNLGFALVSMLFVANLIGWIAAAIVTPEVVKRFTVGRSFTIATAVAIVPAAAIAAGSPFPAMAVMYALFGLSIGTMEALANAWIAARPNKRIRLSCLHFSYGVGALCAPLAGSPFVVADLDFHHFYFASLGLCVLNTLFVTASFKLRKEEEQIELQTLSARQQTTNDAITPQTEIEVDECVSEKNSEVASQRSRSSAVSVHPAPAPAQRQESAGPWKIVLRQKDTHIFAIFCLFYVGTEVSIGGWTSTYIIQVRDDIDSSGHIVSGFWAGLAAGRVMLLPITDFFGAQLAALIYLSLSIALQLVVWFVPNVIANAVAVAMMGMLLGPLFPIMIELISLRIIPRSVQTSAIAYIVSFGSAGSALFPLIFGLMIQRFGPKVLPPLLVATLSIQILIF
ncbi:MFS general substrate transporter, partial [Meira miltonrushii]